MSTTRVQLIDKNTTVGTAAAEDTKIVFDGNAQDYHIGLDDSDDSLTIGLGSALGTTSYMNINADGSITKPLQPAFLVKPSSSQTDFNQGQTITIDFGTEVFDNNGDFSSNTFTAPVTGKYQVNLRIRRENLPANLTYVQTYLATSNGTIYMFLFGSGADLFNSEVNYYSESGSIILNMDANDTLLVKQYQSGGDSTSEIGEQTYLSIALLS